MPSEDRYVRSDEFQKTIGNVYERINDDDRKHSEALNELKVKFERHTVLQEQTYEEQKETNSNLKDLTTIMREFGSEVTEIKYTVKAHDEDIKMIQGTIAEKQKGSVQIVVAIIGFGGTIFTGAFAFAQAFF